MADNISNSFVCITTSLGPAHEIMVLFVFHKITLQTRMRSHPVRLDVRCLVGHFIYFHTLCVRTAKALARLRECAGSPEPSLVAYAIHTIISGSKFKQFCMYLNIIRIRNLQYTVKILTICTPEKIAVIILKILTI